MSTWVRTDYQYDPRFARLFISSRQAMAVGKLDLRSLADMEGPEVIEKVVTDLIEELRPDLSGCIIFEIKYDLAAIRWEFTVFHRSLAPCPMSQRPPLIPLVPDPPGVEIYYEPEEIEQFKKEAE